jgi:hypothetical protein
MAQRLSHAGLARLRARYASVLDSLPPVDPDTGRRAWLGDYSGPCWRPQAETNEPSGDLLCLPRYYILSPSKAGSTFLWEKMMAHPNSAPTRKEHHFWTADRTFNADPGAPRQTTRERRSDRAPPQMSARDPAQLARAFRAYSLDFARAVLGSADPAAAVAGDASTSTLWCVFGWGCPPGREPRAVASALRGRLEPPRAPDAFPTLAGLGPALVPALLREVQPGARLVVLLRDPVERFRSDHFFFKVNPVDEASPSKGLEQRCLRAALRLAECLEAAADDPWRCLELPEERGAAGGASRPGEFWSDTHAGGRCDPCRLAPGLYELYLALWSCPADRSEHSDASERGGTAAGCVPPLVVTLEDLAAKPRTELARIFDFVGLGSRLSERDWRAVDAAGRAARAPSWGRDTHRPDYKLSAPMEAALRRLYAPFEDALAKRLGSGLLPWRRH